MIYLVKGFLIHSCHMMTCVLLTSTQFPFAMAVRILGALLLLGVASLQPSAAYIVGGKWNGTLECVNSTNSTGEFPSCPSRRSWLAN